MCKVLVKIFHCNLVISIVYLAIFIYSIIFYWRELDSKFLQGYLKLKDK